MSRAKRKSSSTFSPTTSSSSTLAKIQTSAPSPPRRKITPWRLARATQNISSTGLYFLTHNRLSLPAGNSSIAANVSNLSRWAPQLAERVSQLLNSGTFNMRWTGSMVADIHRILHQGGVFLYPSQSDRPNGKLRLLYECNPIALILEKAGGDSNETLKIQPTGLHQRIGFVSGDMELVHSLRAE
jgi:fructose-1,6-bisphosphatase I